LLRSLAGLPTSVGLNTTNKADITGTSSQTARANVSDNPVLPKCERTFDRNFRTEVFSVPAVGTLGNSSRTYLRQPGTENWDLSLIKNFPIREPFRLQFRAEAYNVFNHTQSTHSIPPRVLSPAGRQVSATLGLYNAARTPRQMQLALRFNF
jgi:hypothetical protein